jgi:hypothetical protein
MSWTIGGNRFYVQNSLEDTSQILPRLQPLAGGTIVQAFGYDSLIRKMTAIVVGDTIKNAIKGYSQDGGTAHAVVSPEGSLGSYQVRSCAVKRLPITCQTIDTLQPTTAPVYELDVELFES